MIQYYRWNTRKDLYNVLLWTVLWSNVYDKNVWQKWQQQRLLNLDSIISTTIVMSLNHPYLGAFYILIYAIMFDCSIHIQCK